MCHLHLSSTLSTTMGTLLLLLIALSFSCIHGQPDSLGFISIDCGNTASPKYTDDKTNLTYLSDENFTDAGLTHTVYLGNLQPTDLEQRYSTVRLFPNGTRNCYRLPSLTAGGKYFVRAVFAYGNYDGLNRLPTFDLYFGVNYWTTVTIVNASTAYVFDMIAVSPADYLDICLVNIGSGTPFISGLDLRPLAEDLYPESNVEQSLVLLSFFRDTVDFGSNRYHFGTNDHHIRYQDDSYDRMWQKYEDVPSWTDVPNVPDEIVQNPPKSSYSAPSAVMRSASTPFNVSRMDMWWTSDSSMSVGVDPKYCVVLYFTELEDTQELRHFDVLVDNIPLAAAFRPKYFVATVLAGTVHGSGRHVVTLLPISNSTLPPLISAMEIYMVRPVNESITDPSDATVHDQCSAEFSFGMHGLFVHLVDSMMTIQMKYSVKRNWVGDPCAPISLAWDGLNCSYAPSGPPGITALNLAFSGLVGEIDYSFCRLRFLEHLDLSHNNLSGSIPYLLGQGPSPLKFLDLSSNNLSGPIPRILLEKSQRGLLTLRIDNNPNLCGNYYCDLIQNKKNKTILQIVLPAIAAIALLFVALLVLVILPRRKKRPDAACSANPFENRTFKYKELKLITKNFNTVIGKGGFGHVYLGHLENGTPVAVKMRSKTSSQGNTEFLAEAQHLSRVHHRNLVSLIGYCKDKEHLSLVYEYMDGGNLQDRLRAFNSRSVLLYHNQVVEPTS